MYDLLLKGGLIIDPAEEQHGLMDVAVKNGKIARVAKDINASDARKVIPTTGRLITPGLIDMHCHPGIGIRRAAIESDEMGVYSGVTVLVDGGTSGAANFHQLRRYSIERAKTDMFCFLNLSLTGLATTSEIRDAHDINAELTREVIEENRDVIKGVKIRAIGPLARGIGMKAIEIAKQLAMDVKLPLMLHIGEPRDRVNSDMMGDFSREAVTLMEKGDILSHYMTWAAGGLILPNGHIYPELWAAKKRGVLLDSCHGLNNFSLSIAGIAIEQGLLPDIISTDLAAANRPTVQSLLITMSKFLNMGLTLDHVIRMTSITPAKALSQEVYSGSLKVGIPANISILEIVKGDYLFSDGRGRGSLQGNHILEPRLVLKDGIEIPCYSRYQIPPVYTTL